MNINYDKELTQIRSKVDTNKQPRLLLHVCCAPCATYCLTQLLDVFDVTLYYTNDNITDIHEWNKRLGEVRKLVDIVNSGNFELTPLRPLKLAVKELDSIAFYSSARGLEQEKEGGLRCKECFSLRLDDTLQYGIQHGFDYFGTTLTVSPYKNSQLLNQIGLSLQTESTKWLSSDFKKREGYKHSIELSQKSGLYRQHYCGCSFSLEQMQTNK